MTKEFEATTGGAHEAARAALLEGVQFAADFEAVEKVVYDDTVGGLVVPEDDGSLHLVTFRSYDSTRADGSTLARSSPPPEEKGHRTSVHGHGIYMGNSVPAVEVFAWSTPQSEIGVFMTPALQPDEVLDIRHRADKTSAHMAQLATMAFKSVQKHNRGLARIASINESYGDADVVAMDMGPEMFLGHKLQAAVTEHAVKPSWFLWRGDAEAVRRIGTVTEHDNRKAFFSRLQQVSDRFRTS